MQRLLTVARSATKESLLIHRQLTSRSKRSTSDKKNGNKMPTGSSTYDILMAVFCWRVNW